MAPKYLVSVDPSNMGQGEASSVRLIENDSIDFSDNDDKESGSTDSKSLSDNDPANFTVTDAPQLQDTYLVMNEGVHQDTLEE